MNSSTLIKNLTLASLGILVTVSASAFAQNTNFTDVPTPLDSSNPSYPLSRSNALQGGHHQVQTLTDLYAIPVSRLTRGMLAYVVSSDATYRLMTSPSANPTSASDRVLVKSLSYGSGAGAGGSGGGDNTFNISGNSLWLQNGDNIYNGNVGNVGIGTNTNTPISTLTVHGSLSILRGTAVTIPINIPATTVRRIGSTVGTYSYTTQTNSTQGTTSEAGDPIPFGMAKCSCDTNNSNLDCNAGSIITTVATQCYDTTYRNSNSYTVGGTFDGGDMIRETSEDYTVFNINTQTNNAVSFNVTQDISYLVVSTGNNTIQIGTTSGMQSIVTGGNTYNYAAPGTKTTIRGDLEIKDAKARTGAGVAGVASITDKSLYVTSNGTVRKGKRFYESFAVRGDNEINLGNYPSLGNPAERASVPIGTVKMRSVDDGFCYIQEVIRDNDHNQGQREGTKISVYEQSGFRYGQAISDTRAKIGGRFLCVSW